VTPLFSSGGSRASRAGGAGTEAFEADYEALRHGVGAVPEGRDVVRVSGEDALEYLQGQCSQDLGALGAGESAHALLLSPQGKLEALVRVTYLDDQVLLVDVQAGYGDPVRARLDRFKLRVKVAMEQLSWGCVALRGPEAPGVGAGVVTGSGTGGAGTASSLVLPYEWNGVLGVDLLGVSPQVPFAARRCGPDAWESVRVEAGIPGMGTELDGRTLAAEADLLEKCVSLTKGCYTGQEVVARLEARGNRVARRLRGLVMSELPSGAAVPRGSEVILGGKHVGEVTSCAWSPTLQATCALAYLHRDVVPPCEVEVRVPTASDLSEAVAAEARRLPLVG
jgi:folate-binding protein YgfZ